MLNMQLEIASKIFNQKWYKPMGVYLASNQISIAKGKPTALKILRRQHLTRQRIEQEKFYKYRSKENEDWKKYMTKGMDQMQSSAARDTKGRSHLYKE